MLPITFPGAPQQLAWIENPSVPSFLSLSSSLLPYFAPPLAIRKSSNSAESTVIRKSHRSCTSLMLKCILSLDDISPYTLQQCIQDLRGLALGILKYPSNDIVDIPSPRKIEGIESQKEGSPREGQVGATLYTEGTPTKSSTDAVQPLSGADLDNRRTLFQLESSYYVN